MIRAADRERPVVGWREFVALPELGIRRLKVKVDTGARTSALHASHVERFRRRGVDWVRFRVPCGARGKRRSVRAAAALLDERKVRSSRGHAETRMVVEALVEAAGMQWTIRVTLTTRGEMRCAMLLGREAVRGRFLVDPGRSYILSGARGQPSRRARRTVDTARPRT